MYPRHLELGARMVPFGGWDMPVQYSGILAEVNAVRTAAGLFDVSHMGRLHVTGPRAAEFLDWVLTASASNLRVGRARYCFICNESGGVIDDTIFYRLAEEEFLVVPNAGNRLEVVDWFRQWIDRKFNTGCTLEDHTEETALIACQGPESLAIVDALADAPVDDLRPFAWRRTEIAGLAAMIAHTGYTGEDGVEIFVGSKDADPLWQALLDRGLERGLLPCGLGARDVLRLEAGLPLHGHEIDPQTTPIEAGLQRFVAPDKEHVGAAALNNQLLNGVERQLVGFTVPGRSAPRAGYTISIEGHPAGSVTSGSYSPTLDTSIGMGYISLGNGLDRQLSTAALQPGQQLELDIRGRTASAEIVQLPFYSRQPKSEK